jgi:putative membrane protein
MAGLLIRWLILTAAILITSYLLSGIVIANFFSAFMAAAVLGILNALLRPVLLILTLPLNILTLGLFTFFINAFLLKLAAGVIPGFDVQGFWTALFGSMIISIASWAMNTLIGGRGSIDVIDLKRRGDRWE